MVRTTLETWAGRRSQTRLSADVRRSGPAEIISERPRGSADATHAERRSPPRPGRGSLAPERTVVASMIAHGRYGRYRGNAATLPTMSVVRATMKRVDDVKPVVVLAEDEARLIAHVLAVFERLLRLGRSIPSS